MAKITRKAFTRKKIIGGVIAFSAVTIVAVAAAAIVLSRPVEFKNDGYLTVGTVSSQGGTFIQNSTRIYATGDSTKSTPPVYRFEPEEGDNTGRVKCVDYSEVLSLTIEASIEHSERLSFVAAKVLTNELSGEYKIKTAVSKGYIELPEALTFTDTELNIYNVASGTILSPCLHNVIVEEISNGKRLSFAYDVAFRWGSFFNHKNPSVYYDEDNLDLPIGTDDSPAGSDTVIGVLKDLRNLLNGIELTLWLTAK